MSKLEEKIKTFSKPASSVPHSGKIAYTVGKSVISELNSSIQPKIQQNKKERIASCISSKDFIVK